VQDAREPVTREELCTSLSNRDHRLTDRHRARDGPGVATGGHGFRNDGDEEVAFLILFAPGIARENFFAEMAELRRSGRTPAPEEMTAFYARHDQVMIDY
jgi:hypothetical protein